MPKNFTSDKVHVATIVGSHGVHGRVKVMAHTELPEAFTQYGEVTDREGKVLKMKLTGTNTRGSLLVQIEGFTQKEHADAARGTELFVSRDCLPKLDSGKYYQHDLIGLDVKNAKGNVVGAVKALHNYGASDIIEVHYNGSGKDELYIFNKANVPEVNVAEGYMVVIPPDVIVADPNETRKAKTKKPEERSDEEE